MQAFKKAHFRLISTVTHLDEQGLADGDPDRSDTEANGALRIDGEEIILSYSENYSGAEVFTRIRIENGAVTLERRGSIDSVMIFKEGETHTSIYSIPPYSFDMTLTTKRIKSTVSDKGGELTLIYDAEVGGSRSATRMTVTVSV